MNINSPIFYDLFYAELFILTNFSLDLILDFFHRFFIENKTKYHIYFDNKKFRWKFICLAIVLSDSIVFYNYYPKFNFFRFGRLFRACKILIFF